MTPGAAGSNGSIEPDPRRSPNRDNSGGATRSLPHAAETWFVVMLFSRARVQGEVHVIETPTSGSRRGAHTGHIAAVSPSCAAGDVALPDGHQSRAPTSWVYARRRNDTGKRKRERNALSLSLFIGGFSLWSRFIKPKGARRSEYYPPVPVVLLIPSSSH